VEVSVEPSGCVEAATAASPHVLATQIPSGLGRLASATAVDLAFGEDALDMVAQEGVGLGGLSVHRS
jgi:hypothetical protein